jgi:hypothetical protein
VPFVASHTSSPENASGPKVCPLFRGKISSA